MPHSNREWQEDAGPCSDCPVELVVHPPQNQPLGLLKSSRPAKSSLLFSLSGVLAIFDNHSRQQPAQLSVFSLL